jgi:predicted transcriptional regulator
MRNEKSWRERKRPTGQLVSLFTSMRAQTLEYLREHSAGRQIQIADQVGLTRETIGRYISGEYEPQDVYTIQQLWNWKLADEKSNGRAR